MKNTEKIAVCSRSFSKNKILRSELLVRYENVTFNDSGLQLEGIELVNFLSGHTKAIIGLERMDEFVLSRLPELKVIGKYGVGLDLIDLDSMRKFNKRLGWTSGVNKRSVSELVISFMIEMLHRIPAASREVLSGTWRQHVGNLLTGKTIGIIGCGNIGKDLVKLLQPFECPILVHDIRQYIEFYNQYKIKAMGLEELLTNADVVTLHIPLDNTTRGILSKKRIELMKPTAILINAARGGLVDESVLKAVLKEGRLAGAAFDVFSSEPPQDMELIQFPNFLATPHIGGSAEEAILAMGRAAIEGLDQNATP